jgi:hypothetical protein
MSEENDVPPSASEGTPEFTPPMSQSEFYDSLENFDAITDLPTWQGLETLSGPTLVPSIEAFGPDDRKALEERAREINPHNREEALSHAISERLNREAINLRVRSTSDDASELVREHCAQAFELEQGRQKIEDIGKQLEQKRTITDPVTGKTFETDEYVITGQRRDIMHRQLMDTFHRAEALTTGGEGDRRLDAARKKDWDKYVDVHRRVWEAQEVDRRAHKMAQDDRINTAAAARAKHLKAPK